MKIAFVYSGQGSQKVGMGADLYQNSEIFKEAFDLLSPEKREIAFSGEQEILSKTINTQGIMTAFCVGVTEMLRDKGITPEVSMGLSLGEYSALYSAGVFEKKQVVDIINFRAEQMTKAAAGIDCKMAAILGLASERIEECCNAASSLGIVAVANRNCPGQIVISGERAAVERAAELCKEAGAKRAVFLDTEGAFHTQVMEPAYLALSERFVSEQFNAPKIPVILNTVAREPKDTDELKKLLAKQVKSQVNFEQSINYIKELGVDTVIEIGQGKTLCGFIKKTVSDITLYNIEDMASFELTISKILSEGA